MYVTYTLCTKNVCYMYLHGELTSHSVASDCKWNLVPRSTGRTSSTPVVQAVRILIFFKLDFLLSLLCWREILASDEMVDVEC